MGLEALFWLTVGRRYVEDVWDYDVYADVTTYEKDVLILHGDRDGTVDKSRWHRRQKIEIYYKAAGIIDTADDLCEAGDGRGQWRRNRKTA